MKLITCKLCGKVFSSPGPNVCPKCMSDLDEYFQQIRTFLRDKPKMLLNADQLSEEVGIDIRYVQALVHMGYLERLGVTEPEDEAAKKIDLAKQLQASLSKSSGTTPDSRPAKKEEKDSKSSLNAMYAQDKHGTKRGGK